MTISNHVRAWLVLGLGLGMGVGVLAGCGSAAGGDSGSGFNDANPATDASAGVPQCFSSSECPVGWTCSDLGFCEPPPAGDGGVPPPETEYEFGKPVVSQRYVWVAMTSLDEVAKIDGASLAVSAIAVGDHPRELVALPGSDTAVVLDEAHAAATVVVPASGSDTTTVEPTRPDLNRLSASPTGRFAVAWFDLAKAIADAGSLSAVGNVSSLQDVTVLDLTPGATRTVDLTVGYKPRSVQFDSTGTRAYVVTDGGISVIDLPSVVTGGPHIVPPIPISTDPFEDPAGLEVDVNDSGELAIVRENGGAWMRVVALSGALTGQIWQVPLPGAPTDLELARDGSRAYAVLRDQQQLAVIDLPGDAIDPSGVELVDLSDATLGSMTLSPDGHRAVLYTNATLDERLTVIELDQPGYPHRTFPLEKSVRAVGFDPTGDKVLVIHARAPGDPAQATTTDEYIDRRWGYSVVDLATGFAKLELTPVDPGAFAFATSLPRAYLCLDGGDAPGATAELQEIDLDTGVVYSHDLGSPPEEVGVLPDGDRVFVSQRHPLGRVTFLDVSTGATRTVTGFDLNGHVID